MKWILDREDMSGDYGADLSLGDLEFKLKKEGDKYFISCKELKVVWEELVVSGNLPFELISFQASKALFQKYKASTEKFVNAYIAYQKEFQSKGLPR